MIASPSQIIWSLREIMGPEFIQGAFDEFLEAVYERASGDFVVLNNGDILDYRTNEELTDAELMEFITWAKEQEW